MSEVESALIRNQRDHHQPGWVPDLSRFGARLALVRQAMGWGNVKQAAQECAIPVETWRKWERDNIEPKSLVSACMKIAGVTNVDYRWLALGPAIQTQVVQNEDEMISWHASGGRPPFPTRSGGDTAK